MGGLTLVTIAVALSISFGVAVTVPAPSAPPMNLSTAIAALADPSRAPNALKVDRGCNAPSQQQVPLLASTVADALRVAPDRVHAHWVANSEGKSTSLQVITPGRAPGLQANAAIREAFSDPGLELPAFELWLRQADGCWVFVAPSHAPTQAWRMRILIAFALSAALLAPLAWWLALRLSEPLRRLALEAEQLSLDDRSAPTTNVAAATDRRIHEVQVARDAMYALHSRLRSQAEDMTRMLAAVAHDLRTPLTALRLRVDTAPPEQAARMIADMERMDAMITQVLDYARGQSQAEPRIETNLAALVEDCVDDAKALGKPVEVSRIEVIQAPAEPLVLRRALTNLIENAIRYAHGARVGLWREGDWIVLQVDDDGPGIPAEQSERLQQPFQRLESSRNLETGGIGLGLAVVRMAALRHGGSLSLRNRDSGGLSARIQWPLEK